MSLREYPLTPRSPTYRSAIRRTLQRCAISEAETGSTIVLIPTITLIALLLCFVTIDSAAISIYQTRTDHIAQDAALAGARDISQSIFYSTGRFELNSVAANSTVSQYISSLGSWNRYQIVNYACSTYGNAIQVEVAASVQLPIPLPSWLFGRSMAITARSTAKEYNASGAALP